MTDQYGDVCSFFKKPSRSKNIRKRTIESNQDDDDGDQEPQTSLTTQRPKKTRVSDKSLHFSSASSSSKPYCNESIETEGKSKTDGNHFHFESSKVIQVQNDSRATASLQTETEFDRDARAIRERVLKRAKESLKGKSGPEAGNEKVYRGLHGYTDYKAGFRREQTVAGEKAGGAHGPLRASAHIRSSVRFDYQPDICKDYKETGYCGFGDACKFMHDRGDYKSGWQLEKDWEERENSRKRALAMGVGGDDGGGASDGDDDDDGDEFPFACFICRRPFEDPVVTKCKHFFCEHCALKYARTKDSAFPFSISDEKVLGSFSEPCKWEMWKGSNELSLLTTLAKLKDVGNRGRCPYAFLPSVATRVIRMREEIEQWEEETGKKESTTSIKHHSKNKKCFVCNKPTLGIFNAAHEIRKKIAQEKKE